MTTENKQISKRGFTLIELLVSVGIIGILSAVTVFVVNPVELFRQARDSQRQSDILALTGVLKAVQLSPAGVAAASIVNISIPGEGCPGVSMPLAVGWSYRCAAEDAVTAIDGNGWIPVNLNANLGKADEPAGGLFPVAHAAQSAITILPVDPLNTAADGFYYAYIAKSKQFTVSAKFESERYQEEARADGGPDADRYEAGSNLTLWNIATGGAAGLTNGLVGHWKLDETSGSTASDSSGNGHDASLVNNPSWVEGKDGNSLKFDGFAAQQKGIVPSSIVTDYPFTITAWFNTGDPYDILTIAALTNEPEGNWEKTLFLSGSYLCLRSATDKDEVGNTYDSAVACAAYEHSLNKWHLGAAVFAGPNDYQLYLDGVLGVSNGGEAFPTIPFGSPTEFTIGNDNDAQYERSAMNGLIDDVRLYDRALPQLEVQALYDQFTAASDPNLIAYWPFSEGAGTVTLDASGQGNNGALHGGVSWTYGKLGKGLNFNGVGSYVRVSDAPQLRLKDDLSIVAWIYPDNCSDFKYLLEKGQDENDNYSFFMNGCTPSLEYQDESGIHHTIDSAPLSPGAWHHVAVVKDGGTTKFYKEGIFWMSKEDPDGLSGIQTSDLFIGRQNYGASTYPWVGTLDEIRIYDRALTDVEIDALYTADTM